MSVAHLAIVMPAYNEAEGRVFRPVARRGASAAAKAVENASR